METESLSEDIIMTVMDLMQVTYGYTPGMEAAGINSGQTLMGKLQVIALAILCL